MRSLYNLLAFTACVYLISGCTEEVPLDVDFEPQIFISGVITNYTDYVGIQIQASVPAGSPRSVLNPVTNASISLFTKDPSENTTLVTNEFTLLNNVYQSNDMISPIIGNHYWIEVTLLNGTTYKSDQELLMAPVLIKDILGGQFEAPKVQFSDPESDDNFYMAMFRYARGDEELLVELEVSSDVLFNGNENAIIESGSSIGGDEIELQVRLFNLNFGTYQFLRNSIAQDDVQSSTDPDEDGASIFFLPMPPDLIGNITNTTTNRTALGFFGAVSFDFQ